MKQHTLWIERYRSQNLEQYIGNETIKARVADCISKNDIPHFLFAGSAGTGKTTLAKLIVKNIKCDYLYINASDENGIDMIRERVKGFASTSTFQPLKVVILDEADFLTQPAQAALRNLIEEYSITTRFVLTCNYIDRLIEPLQSRCEIHLLKPPSKGDVARHICTNILDVEEVKYEMKDIAILINEYYPDIRSIIKNLQAGLKNNEFQITILNTTLGVQLVNLLKNPKSNTWYECRQLIIDSQLDDYQPIILHLFEHITEYSKGHDAEITIELDNHQYFQKSVPDKELNMASLISKILNLNKKQVI
jgi:replication factor C small subunit